MASTESPLFTHLPGRVTLGVCLNLWAASGAPAGPQRGVVTDALGVRVRLVRPVLIGATALITGAAVAVSGTIAFVDLVVPHILRLVVGPDHRVLVPVSAVGGALFLLSSDTIARSLAPPVEIRVGIITSLVGAPFFIFLLLKHKRRIGLE